MTSHLKCSKYNIKLVSCTVNFGIIDRNFRIAGVHRKLRDNPEKIWILGRYGYKLLRSRQGTFGPGLNPALENLFFIAIRFGLIFSVLR